MKKVLLITSIRENMSHFCDLAIKYFKDRGYEVYVVVYLERCDKEERIHAQINHVTWIPVDFRICPFSLTFWKAYRTMVKLMKENEFELVHIETCLGAFMSRLVARRCHKRSVIFTAQPFLQYYYQSRLKTQLSGIVERIAAHWTDALVTLNQSDYLYAESALKLRGKKVYKINGIGIYTQEHEGMLPMDKRGYRRQIGVDENDLMVTVISRLDKSERISQIIMATATLSALYSNIKLVIVGEGHARGLLEEQVHQLKIERQVIFLGKRNDTEKIIGCTDIVGAFPSREYVVPSLIQAVIDAKAVICTDTVCNKDMVIDGVNGFLVAANDVRQTVQKLKTLYETPVLLKSFQEANRSLRNRFTLQRRMEEIKHIYDEILFEEKGENRRSW